MKRSKMYAASDKFTTRLFNILVLLKKLLVTTDPPSIPLKNMQTPPPPSTPSGDKELWSLITFEA